MQFLLPFYRLRHYGEDYIMRICAIPINSHNTLIPKILTLDSYKVMIYSIYT